MSSDAGGVHAPIFFCVDVAWVGNLAEFYEQHAAVKLVERKDTLRRGFASDAAEGLRDKHDARSRQRFNRKIWQSALYRALSRNENFYSSISTRHDADERPKSAPCQMLSSAAALGNDGYVSNSAY
ncbi:hypothetical protein [Gluconobacter cerinus]|uniref:hypothetical protein n=1 Tax=Gluconobacter cerinus TaxID=38307 RepID=UPI001C046E2B|nr:hypothetical protein [Gluconobacter cerinus]